MEALFSTLGLSNVRPNHNLFKKIDRYFVDIIAMQVDLDIPMVIDILKELDVYRGQIDDGSEDELTLVNH
jgi:hypothetical protein